MDDLTGSGGVVGQCHAGPQDGDAADEPGHRGRGGGRGEGGWRDPAGGAVGGHEDGAGAAEVDQGAQTRQGRPQPAGGQQRGAAHEVGQAAGGPARCDRLHGCAQHRGPQDGERAQDRGAHEAQQHGGRVGQVEAVGQGGAPVGVGPGDEEAQERAGGQQDQGDGVVEGQGGQAWGDGPAVLHGDGHDTRNGLGHDDDRPDERDSLLSHGDAGEHDGGAEAVGVEARVQEGGAAQGRAVQEGVGEVGGPDGDGAADPAQEQGVQGQPGSPGGQGAHDGQGRQDRGDEQPGHDEGVATYLGGAPGGLLGGAARAACSSGAGK